MKIIIYVNENDLSELDRFVESTLGFYHNINFTRCRINDEQVEVLILYNEFVYLNEMKR